MLAKNNINLVSLMVISIVILVTLIIAEWGSMRMARQTLLEDINNVETRGYKIEELPSIDLFKSSIDEYSEMINRPLFVKGRRPIEIDESNDSRPVIVGEFNQILIGIFGTQQGMSALFKNENPVGKESKFNKVYVGDDLDGWKVDEIYNDKVILSQAGSQQQVGLHKPRLEPKTITKENRRRTPPRQEENKKSEEIE